MWGRAQHQRDRDITSGVLTNAARLVLPLLALALLAALPPDAAAQAQTFEQIRAYDVDITIERDGALVIAESIAYVFPTERHGILREIPVRLRYDDTFDRVYPLQVLSVAATGGASAEYAIEDAGGGLTRIRIGDPDRTVRGDYTYVIRYRVQGGLNAFPDHDELYWNATGNQWPVPITRPSVRVHAPAAPTEVACFAGPTGSARPCATARIEENGAVFEHRSLSSNEGVTVVVALAKGVVSEPRPILEERWSLRRAFAITPLTLALTIVLAAAVAFGITRLYWRTGRDLRWGTSAVEAVYGKDQPEAITPLNDEGPLPAQYTPYEGMRPGLMGTLFDEVANPLDVTVTIVDLAARGYLRIEEVEPEGILSWFAKPDWRLVHLKEPGDLLPYERTLHNALFASGTEVKLSDLKNTFASKMAEVQKQLYEEVVRRGWYSGSPEGTRNKWLGISVVALLAAGGIQFLATRYTHFALVPTSLVLGALTLLILHRSMPRRTGAGTAAIRHVRGFRRFIDDAEDERARFAEQANLFYDYLPYAIVFGLAAKWAHAFEGLANQPSPPGWYVSSHAFNVAAFSSSMDTFGVTATGTIASTPGGSGSSGFGGSSGGGGGGGGGGSW